MMEMSCRWWPIWYLLFFCHGAEGQLQWIVKEKVTDYGQNLTLFCPVGNCCSEPPGWFVGPKTIILDVRTFSNDPKVKYHGTYNTDGFGVVIRNLSEADLNVTYSCIYGFNQSTPKYLFHGDVFKEKINVDECCNNTGPPDQCKDPMSNCTEVVSGDYKCSCNPGYYNNGGTCNIQINVDECCNNTRSPNQCKDPMSNCTEVVSGDYKCSCKPGYYSNGGTCDKDKDEENDTVAIALSSVAACIIVALMAYVYRSRIIKKKQEQTGTDEEMERLNDSEHEQDNVHDMEIEPLNTIEIQQDNVHDMEIEPLNTIEIQQDLKEDAEKERTETSLDLWKTLKAKPSSTAVVVCHREVKSAITKANEELKKQLETFIKENNFYYNDRFLEQNSINISQGNEAVT